MKRQKVLEEEAVQKTLEGIFIDKYKERARNAVEASADRVKEITIPIVGKLLDIRLKKTSDNPELIEMQKNNPELKQEKIKLTEQIRNEATNFDFLKKRLLDFNLFFGKVTGINYKEPVFQENTRLISNQDEVIEETYRIDREVVKELFRGNFKNALQKRIEYYKFETAVLSDLSYNLLAAYLLDVAATTPDHPMRSESERALKETWNILLENGYPNEPEFINIIKGNRGNLDGKKLSEHIDYLKNKWPKKYLDSVDCKLSKPKPSVFDKSLKDFELWHEEKKVFKKIVTPQRVLNGNNVDSYAYAIDAYIKFGDPISKEKFFRDELSIKNVTDHLKDFSDVMDFEKQTLNKFLEKQPEIRRVIEYLQKCGIDVLDGLRKIEFAQDIFPYVVETVIDKNNVFKPGNKDFDSLVKRTLVEYKKLQDRFDKKEPHERYKINASQEEIISTYFVELWQKVKLISYIKTRFKSHEKALYGVLQYKVQLRK